MLHEGFSQLAAQHIKTPATPGPKDRPNMSTAANCAQRWVTLPFLCTLQKISHHLKQCVPLSVVQVQHRCRSPFPMSPSPAPQDTAAHNRWVCRAFLALRSVYGSANTAETQLCTIIRYLTGTHSCSTSLTVLVKMQ
jgi:hypothetical protein